MTTAEQEAAMYAVRHPEAFVSVVVRCSQKGCEVARLQDIPKGRILTVMQRGLEVVEPPIGAPPGDLSALPMNLARSSGLPTQKGKRNICYSFDAMPDGTAWSVICRCEVGVVTAAALEGCSGTRGESGTRGCLD